MSNPPIALLADRSNLVRTFLRSELSSLGFTVMQCFSGPELVECARNNRARIVLLGADLQGYDKAEGYAGFNGFEACLRVRILPGYVTVPILVMYSEPQDPAVGDRLLQRLHISADRARATRLMKRSMSANDVHDALSDHVTRDMVIQKFGGKLARPGFASKAPTQVWEPIELGASRRGVDDFLSKGAETLARLRDLDALGSTTRRR